MAEGRASPLRWWAIGKLASRNGLRRPTAYNRASVNLGVVSQLVVVLWFSLDRCRLSARYASDTTTTPRSPRPSPASPHGVAGPILGPVLHRWAPSSQPPEHFVFSATWRGRLQFFIFRHGVLLAVWPAAGPGRRLLLSGLSSGLPPGMAAGAETGSGSRLSATAGETPSQVPRDTSAPAWAVGPPTV